MNRRTEQAYKRMCFHGRGIVARWLDRAFFALLGAISLYLLCRILWLSILLCVALVSVFLLWDYRRWMRYRHDLWQKAVTMLRRKDWSMHEAERIRQAGGIVLYPIPEVEALTGLCLRFGKDAAFHCFGEPGEDLIVQAETLGCALSFHPWQEGSEPSRKQVLEQLERDAPKGEERILLKMLHLPGNRYLLTGCFLLLLSIFLRRALYWRLIGSLCLLIGAVRRAFHVSLKA